MAESKYSQFKKYILFQEDFLFITSLYFIFNEENEVKTINNELRKLFTKTIKTNKTIYEN